MLTKTLTIVTFFFNICNYFHVQLFQQKYAHMATLTLE